MAKEENEKEKNKPKPCPKWLNNTAKKEWRRVAKILAEEGKDFTDKDLKALEAYCINYAKWQRCEQIIDEKGYSTNDDRRHKRRSRRPGTDVRAVGRS